MNKRELRTLAEPVENRRSPAQNPSFGLPGGYEPSRIIFDSSSSFFPIPFPNSPDDSEVLADSLGFFQFERSSLTT